MKRWSWAAAGLVGAIHCGGAPPSGTAALVDARTAAGGERPPGPGAPGDAPVAPPVEVDPADPVVSLGTLRVAPGKASRVEVSWGLPPGTAVNEEAPVKLVWTSMEGLRRLPDAVKVPGEQAQGGFTFSVEPADGAAGGQLTGVLQLVACDEVTYRVCVPIRRTVKAAFTVDPGAGAAAAVLPLPEAR